MEEKRIQLLRKLYDIEAVKLGNFKLKSGIESPIYFDLRVIVSYPAILNEVSELIWQTADRDSVTFSHICGVPYTALPIATVISSQHDIPMLIRRKESKDYGTKKIIEGSFRAGDTCLVVEDVVTTGSSVMETVQALQAEQLVVNDAIVLLDREQGGVSRLSKQNIRLHSVFTITELLSVLLQCGKIDTPTVMRVYNFLAQQSNPEPVLSTSDMKESSGEGTKNIEDITSLTYEERAQHCKHPVAKKLLEIMTSKSTNLVLAADVTTSAELLELANDIGPHICALKTHVDILEDFTSDVVKQLTTLATKHHFLIFEDRKFADIGSTVLKQFSGGVYNINQWADLVTVHSLPGPGIVEGLKRARTEHPLGCLLLAQMSSDGNLCSPSYTKETVAMAEKHRDFVVGFISTSRVSDDPGFLHFTPGVQLEAPGDDLGQRYLTPEEVICNRKCDLIIVGRGISMSPNPSDAARLYQEQGYLSYKKRCSKT